MEQRDDGEVVARCLAGDAKAFEEIVRSYQNRIFATVYRILGNAEDARDLAQETFLRAYSKLETFREGARFSTWLYTIALNLTRSELRKRKARAKTPVVSLHALGNPDDARPAEPPARGETPDETLGREELYRLALREVEALEPEAREVVVLRDMQDLSYDEIAEVLDIPKGTVRSRLHRARSTLRQELTPLIAGRRRGGAA